MIRINLLPHREEKRKARRTQFFVLSGLIATLAGLIVFLGWSINAAIISEQDKKNAFLKAENEKLDKQIVQIRTLKDEINVMLAKKKVIEDLQSNRGRAVGLFNEMARQIPEGVYLKTLKQDGLRVALTGVSHSNSRVSEMMRNISQSALLEQPRLIETKVVTVDKKKMQDFSMTVQIKVAKADTQSPAKPAAPAVKPPAGEGKK